MKGRSHRVASASEPDDWVDGSWTVDCTCGVTFDDGEEMVSCDDCGVWVHTRCSRFIRGQTSFTCDNCKSKSSSSRKESEEEVAELLVELPTKPMPMGFAPARRQYRLWTDRPMSERVHVQGVPGGDPELFKGLPSIFTPQLWKCTGYVPKRLNFQYREFPCWDDDDKPLPAFGELLACYPEEEEKNQKDADEEPANIGADVLFSLKEARSKPDKGEVPAVERGWKEENVSDKDDDEDEARHPALETEMKKRDVKAFSAKRLSNHSKVTLDCAKNEKAHPNLESLHLNKRKRDEASQDQVAKKRTKSNQKDDGNKNKFGSRKAVHQFNGFKLSCQEPKNTGEDTKTTLTGGDMQVVERATNKETRPLECNFDEHKGHEDHCVNFKSGPDVPFSTESTIILSNKQENLEDANGHGFATIISSPKLVGETKAALTVPVRLKVPLADEVTFPHDSADQNGNSNVASAVPSVEPQLPPRYQKLTVRVPVGHDELLTPKKDTPNSPDSSRVNDEIVAEDAQFAQKTPSASASIVNNGDDLMEPKLIYEMPDGPSNSLSQEEFLFPFPTKSTTKQVGRQGGPKNKGSNKENEIVQEHDAILSPSMNVRSFFEAEQIGLPTSENENLINDGAFRSSEHDTCTKGLEELGVTSTALDSFSKSKRELGVSHPSQKSCLKYRQELVAGSSLLDCQDGSSKSVHGVKHAAGSKLFNTKLGTSTDKRNRFIAENNKLPVSGITSKDALGAPVNDSISSATDSSSHKRPSASVTTSLAKPHSTKIHEKSSCGTSPASPIGKVRVANSQEMSGSSGKDRLKISLRSGSKVPPLSKLVSPSTSKHGTFSKHKEESVLPHLNSTAISSGSGNPSGSSLDVSSVLKRPPLDSSSKTQIHTECSQSSMRVAKSQSRIHGPTPVNAASALSDEELALLLHQELNSSPRVPRVPRVRQAGSGSQVVPQTTFSTLAKRSSVNATQVSSGGKGHPLAQRRKAKDDTHSGSSRLMVYEAMKAKRKPPPYQIQEEFDTVDLGEKSSEDFGHTKKMSPLAASGVGRGRQSSSADASDPMVVMTHKGTEEISDEDATGHDVDGAHTLPGLIDDILSKHKDMSYQKLCDAVLPHWHNLRKHNGERYAYSSHSHAVLDCLRNRNSWAQLVDRGPKTNSSRKRRKPDNDSANIDSDTGDESTDISKLKHGGTADSHQHDVPKGNHRSRNSRRLALQGRSLRNKGKRRMKTVISDDDDDDELEEEGGFSASSGGADKTYNDDQSEGVGVGTLRSKISSSDESESE